LADLKVYPNPASEYLIASADGIIDFVQLTALNGATVAVAQGNILNVSEVAEGTYLVNIYTNAGRTVRKVVVKH
jgi:flagellar basal body P-ring protein FlgI